MNDVQLAWVEVGSGEVHKLNPTHQALPFRYEQDFVGVVVVESGERLMLVAKVVRVKPHEIRSAMPVGASLRRISEQVRLPQLRLRNPG
jgi:sugar lactone lactonase YvrE